MSHLPIAILLAVLASLPAALLNGVYRWHAVTQELRARLEAARVPVRLQTVEFRELEGMPAPVQRYFRAVLRAGQPLVTAVDVKHAGTFNLNESGERWRPFTSRQRVMTQRPGFMWDGRIAMLPGVAVHVHDAYVAGEGILHPALFGLIALADMRDTGGDLARGELMRFFAEAAWSRGRRPGHSHALGGTLLELPCAKWHARAAHWRCGLALARGTQSLLARSHHRDRL